MNETLYVVMPAYNEEVNIENVVREWYPVLDNAGEESRMVISDGGSKDKTLDILYELQKEYPKLVVIPKPDTDHGTKVIFLYKYAIEKHADWIFQTDSDGQTTPKEFLEFWELRKAHDIIMGDRTKRGDGFIRKFVEIVLRVLLWMFFGVMVPDANAPFRLMKAEVVNKYINVMSNDFYLPNAILAACFSRYKENVIYKEVTFLPRQGGKNFMNLRRIFKIGMDSLYDFGRIKKHILEKEKCK